MKYINLFLICLTAVFLSSCVENVSETIIGTWNLQALEVVGCPPDETDDIVIENGCFELDGNTSCIKYIFREDDVVQFITSSAGGSDITESTFITNDGSNIISVCDELGSCYDLRKSGDFIRFSIGDFGCQVTYVYQKE